VSEALAPALAPCGPIVDVEAANRAHERLAEAASDDGWAETLEGAWPALAPAFAASPYLFGLARRWPDRLRAVLEDAPETRLTAILADTEALTGGADDLRAPLRRLKGELHLLTALADLGGVWDLDQVTGALSRFADVSVNAALRAVAHDQRERGKLISAPGDPRGPAPGLFGLAMGKHGAFELNYSSDIDISLFWAPDALIPALAEGVEPQRFVDRLAQSLATLMQERTGDGYVFRVDLRLRPDPSSTPPVVAAPTALAYYESVGQNWERAAFIKARAVLGDVETGRGFLKALTPFIWRRSLDYPAILDIQSIKRQIHVHKTGEGLDAAGANLKLGRGGIREIEFFAQTQQLILGGRDPGLRQPRTVDALAALRDAGHVDPDACAELTAAYIALRGLEHRVQMLDDEQTHSLPVEPGARARVAALAGEGDLAAFDARVEALLVGVNRRYGELFEGEEQLSSPYGSLVFTGVENDPETLETLARMGFSDPVMVAGTIRGWHHGRIPATRSARGRELFTRLAPPPADRAGGHRRGRRGLSPVRGLLLGPQRGGAGPGPVPGPAEAVRSGGRGHGLRPPAGADAGPLSGGAGQHARRPLRPQHRGGHRRRRPGGCRGRRRAGLRGRHERRAPGPSRADVPHRRPDPDRTRRPRGGWPRLHHPGRRLPWGAGADGHGRDSAPGRRPVRRRGRGGRPRQGGFARDDRDLRPRPDDRL
jgi:glutamate-ammonia-ligase adenylyltransferase